MSKNKEKEGRTSKGQRKEDKPVEVNKAPGNDNKLVEDEKAGKQDDVSKKFPNFSLLNEEERQVFFEALTTARNNLQKKGVPTRQRFGTIHDEYLSHFKTEKESDSEKPAPRDPNSVLEEKVSPFRHESTTFVPQGGDPPQKNISSDNLRRVPTYCVRCPLSEKAKPEVVEQCESVISQNTNRIIDLYVKKKKKNEGKLKIPTPEKKGRPEKKRGNQTKENVRKSLVGKPPKTRDTPRFDALSPEEKEVFFRILDEARSNVVEKNTTGKKNDVLPLDSIAKMYQGCRRTTNVFAASPKVHKQEQEKNLYVKVTLTSGDVRKMTKSEKVEEKNIEENNVEEKKVEKKIEKKAEKGEEKVKKKVEEKTEKVEEKTDKKVEEKTEKVEEKVKKKVEEKADKKVEEKVDKKVEEKVDKKVEEKADKKLEEKADKKVEEKADKKLEEKADKKVEEKVGKKVEEKVDKKVEEKVGKKVEEKVDKKVEEKVGKKVEEKVDKKVEEKVDKKVEEKADKKVEEKAGKKVEEKADKKLEEKADKKVEEKADKKLEEKADKKVEEKADKKVEEKADKKVEEKADKKVEEKKSEERAKGVSDNRKEYNLKETDKSTTESNVNECCASSEAVEEALKEEKSKEKCGHLQEFKMKVSDGGERNGNKKSKESEMEKSSNAEKKSEKVNPGTSQVTKEETERSRVKWKTSNSSLPSPQGTMERQGGPSSSKWKESQEAESVRDAAEKEDSETMQGKREKFSTPKVMFVEDNVIEKIRNLILYLEVKARKDDRLEKEYIKLLVDYVDYLSRVLEALVLKKNHRQPPFKMQNAYVDAEVHLKFNDDPGARKTPKTSTDFGPRSISGHNFAKGLMAGLSKENITEKGSDVGRESELKVTMSHSETSVAPIKSGEVPYLPPLSGSKKVGITKIRLLQDLLKKRAEFVEGEDLKIVHHPVEEYVPVERPGSMKSIAMEKEEQARESNRFNFVKFLLKFFTCGKKKEEEYGVFENLKGEAVKVVVSEGKNKDPANATLNQSVLEVLKAAGRKKVIEKFYGQG